MTTDDAAWNGPQTVSLADEESVKQILVGTVLGLLDIVNNLTRLRPSRTERSRVTIFGSSRARPGTFAYDEIKRVAGVLAEMGCDIVTGGGPGLMQAANEGAVAVGAPERDRSVGIWVALPFEQGATRSSSRSTSTRRSSCGCTTSSWRQTPSWSPRRASARCSS